MLRRTAQIHRSLGARSVVAWCLGILAGVFPVFLGYSMIRTMDGGMGFSPALSLIALAFSWVLMSIPVGAIMCVTCGVTLLVGVRAFPSGDCQRCGYSGAGLPTARCPECANDRFEPRPERPTFGRLVVWYLIAIGAASLAAGVFAEAILIADEAAFAREVRSYVANGGTGTLVRDRWWPNTDCSFLYQPGRGIRAMD